MGNVTLPTPIFVAGGALALLGGYLVGVVAGPDTPGRTTAVVRSFTAGSERLCLGGDTVQDAEGVGPNGLLCGVWRRSSESPTPHRGDLFRFVSMVLDQPADGAQGPATVIYGDVVP